jgi:hypothetical protein
MGVLRHMVSREVSAFGRLDTATDDDIIDRAAQMLASGVWHVHAPKGSPMARTSASAAGPGDAGGATDLPEKAFTQKPPQVSAASSATKLSWIEIRLVDANGKPVPGAAYEITLPDGSIRSGSLSEKGVARYDQIPAGPCEVRFPELDAKEWQRA